MTERHFGIATGILDPGPAYDVLTKWQHRLVNDHPPTWGQALGTSVHELRWLFHDNHLWAAGEDHDLLRDVDPHAAEPRAEREDGTMVSEQVVDDVLCIRLHQCGGGGKAGEQLTLRWQHGHARHFTHQRIVVDLRGNPGGDDRYMIGWIRDDVRHDVTWPTWREWRIGDQVANSWNVAVYYQPERRDESLSSAFAAFDLDATSQLHVAEDPLTLGQAPSPWQGRMLVVTDKGSASAAESATWMLRTGFDAKVIGGRSSDATGFGNLAPYLLPRSGLKIDLPTASSGWHHESMVGMPIDLAYDVHTPLADIAREFDAIYLAATSHRR
jgi:hypothetical protein